MGVPRTRFGASALLGLIVRVALLDGVIRSVNAVPRFRGQRVQPERIKIQIASLLLFAETLVFEILVIGI